MSRICSLISRKPSSNLCLDLEFVSALTEKTRFTVVAGSVERKKGTLLFKGKTESLVQRNATQQEKGPSLFPAGDGRITRGEGATDGEVIKKITSGDNKGVEKMCAPENRTQSTQRSANYERFQRFQRSEVTQNPTLKPGS